MSLKRATTRRQFITGRSAAEALAELASGQTDLATQAGPASPWRPQAQPRPYLVQLGRRAMACQFDVLVNAGQYPRASEVAIEALDRTDAIESQLTVYRETSEVARLNRTAASGPVEVEAGLFELLERAAEWHRETAGAFDVTSGPLSKVWGFYRRVGSIPSDENLAGALARVGNQHVEFDKSKKTIRFRIPGVELNLGAIGKGYALDRSAERMLDANIHDFIWHGGRSSILAGGSRASTTADEGWVVALEHPLRPGKRLAEIRLVDRALGTSGSGTQFFRHQGRRYGHILDPRTGHPAQGVLSATAIAPNATDADALSTAFYILGADEAVDFCNRHQEIGLVMVLPGRTSGEVEVVTAGTSEDDCQLFTE